MVRVPLIAVPSRAEIRLTPPGATVTVSSPRTMPRERPVHRSAALTESPIPSCASDTRNVRCAVGSVLKTPTYQLLPFGCRLTKTCSWPRLMTRRAAMPS
jgi:hypothetical protein